MQLRILALIFIEFSRFHPPSVDMKVTRTQCAIYVVSVCKWFLSPKFIFWRMKAPNNNFNLSATFSLPWWFDWVRGAVIWCGSGTKSNKCGWVAKSCCQRVGRAILQLSRLWHLYWDQRVIAPAKLPQNFASVWLHLSRSLLLWAQLTSVAQALETVQEIALRMWSDM